MSKMIVTVLTGPQGGGKSSLMRDDALQNPGLYLFASPIIELLEEQYEAFKAANPALKLSLVHSKAQGRGAVADRLAYARDEIIAQGHTHAVILTTHEALMGSDLSKFNGWHGRVDEAPAAVQAGVFGISEMRISFKKRFDLEGTPDSEHSVVRLKGEAPSWRIQEKNLGGKELTEFYKHAAHDLRVIARLRDWDERDEVEWFSMWTPLDMRNFASVQIAGSAYLSSVGYRVARATYSQHLEFQEKRISKRRIGQPQIHIHYFTSSHKGSSAYWSTSPGRLQIVRICDHLAQTLPSDAYWSGNTVAQELMEHRLPGTLIKANASGLNKYRDRTACAYIFSAKLTKADKPLERAFQMTTADIEKAREDDAIAQFVMRGAIREADYDGPFKIYLYEKVQAERLRDHLQGIGFTDVTLVPETVAGIMDVQRPKGSAETRSPEDVKKERRQRDADRKRRVRAAKAADEGRVPGVAGNPKQRL